MLNVGRSHRPCPASKSTHRQQRACRAATLLICQGSTSQPSYCRTHLNPPATSRSWIRKNPVSQIVAEFARIQAHHAAGTILLLLAQPPREPPPPENPAANASLCLRLLTALLPAAMPLLHLLLIFAELLLHLLKHVVERCHQALRLVVSHKVVLMLC